HCPGHHREGRAGGAGSHAAAGENGLGGRSQGRRRGPGLYPLLLHQPPRRPGTLYPPPGGGDGAAGGAAVRRTPEGPPQGPLHSQRRSGGVSGSVPGCRLCVHQL
ncbi:50S ribosomal protein L21, partial [Dysosmobacter welbionis]